MMLKASQQQVIAGSRQTEWRPSAVPPARARRTTCRAAEKETVPESVQESSGFVAYDSAGQSNMYPVMTKAYADNGPSETAAANAGIAVGAAMLSIGAIAVGLIALSNTGSDVSVEQFKSLSEYAAAFATQL